MKCSSSSSQTGEKREKDAKKVKEEWREGSMVKEGGCKKLERQCPPSDTRK